ncbi:hypothetical protein BDO18943_04118 [Burkholderia dolosa]|nr:hypothetical protein BDO18943_04118 [Burkholderia dolosa]
MNQPRAAHEVEQPRFRRVARTRVLHPEFVGPCDERAEQQLVVGQNHDRHREDHPADRAEVAVGDRLRKIRADARQRDGPIADRDRLRRDDEEPAARHRHHHVPDQPRHRERYFELPEALPRRQMEPARHFVEIARHRTQRLIEAERHVPRLAREDREDRRELRAEHAARKQREEERDRKRDIAEHRHRLQDVEDRHQHHPRAPAFCGERAVDERERERCDHRGQHPQRRAQRIFGQIRRIERDLLRLQRADRRHRLMKTDDRHRKHADDQRKRDGIPAIGQHAPRRSVRGTVRIETDVHR